MEVGNSSFIVVAYTVVINTFSTNIFTPCVWTPAGVNYAHEYRIYNWPSASSTVALNNIGRISTTIPTSYPACHPLAPGWYGDFACDGTVVMDVNIDKDKVAFSWSGNCGTVQCTVGSLNGAGVLTTGIDYISPFPSMNPADVAFRRDPTTIPFPTDYIVTLIPDSNTSVGYFVTQDEFNDVLAGTVGTSSIHRVDDAGPVPFGGGTMLGGTALTGGLFDHAKLDVPDVSPERRWAYTWSNGTNIHLRRYATMNSLDPSSPIGSSTTQVVNDGSLLDIFGARVTRCNNVPNAMPAISYTLSNAGVYRQQIAWRTRNATDNWVGIEVDEIVPWPAPAQASSTLDYLDIQSANTNRATEYIALSHGSNMPFLYTAFMQNDNLGVDYLNHKNHDFGVSSFWRVTDKATISGAASDLVKVGPNPFSDELKISSNEPLRVQLNDVTGRSIGNYYGDATILNTRVNAAAKQLIPGTYFLNTISDSGDKKVFKLSKQKFKYTSILL